jgi:small subunit ribosomal protein S16
MAVKIKLTRLGKIRNPQYRIAVADARTRRDGRSIEVIGRYHPKEEPSLIEIDSERAQYWLSVGAQPTEPVLKLLKITGDWQKFKGLPGAEGTLKIKEPGPSKLDLFNAALAEAEGGPSTEATTAKKKKAPAKKAAKATGAAGPATSGAEPAEAEASAEPAEAEATEAKAEAAPVVDESEPAAEGADAAAPAEGADAAAPAEGADAAAPAEGADAAAPAEQAEES